MTTTGEKRLVNSVLRSLLGAAVLHELYKSVDFDAIA